MNAETKKLSKVRVAQITKRPCDGKRRFSVKGSSFDRLTYSEAYHTIAHQTGCQLEGESPFFSLEGQRRLRALNRLYEIYAKDYLEVANWQIQQLVGPAGKRSES